MRKVFACAALAAALVASPKIAPAATLTTNGDGQLTGASGLDLGTLGSYDASLVEGTCAALFDTCTSNSDFAFSSQADATTAANALLGLLAGTTFSANPDLTLGCGPTYVSQCLMIIPYAVDAQGNVSLVNAANNSTLYGVPDGAMPSSINLTVNDSNTANDASRVYAVFSRSPSSVPELATWAMMLVGFAAIGMSFRLRKVKLLQLA